MQAIGVFPLAVVLLPTEQLPLHIFEPRYRELIGECLETGGACGIVFEDASGVREIGTLATVDEVVHRFEDGRLNVVVCGRQRFRVAEWTEGRSFRTAEVEEIADGDDPADAAEAERAVGLFRRLAEHTSSEVEPPEPGGPLLSFELAARVDFGTEVKQALLESRSERERLARVAELLGAAVDALTLEREVGERASKNGKVFSPKE